MRLTFEGVKMLLTNVNARSERHGDDRQSAGDVNFQATVPNDILGAFHPKLKALLYHLDKSREQDLADQGRQGDKGFMPHVQMPDLHMPLKWNGEMEKGKLTIKPPAGAAIVLEDVKVCKFSIDCKEFGLVELGFQVQAHPDQQQFGQLCDGLIQTEVEVTIEQME